MTVIALTEKGRARLARAVEELTRRPDAGAALALFEALPAGDRQRLLNAAPRDVFLTALRAWRLARPGLARDLCAAALMLQSGLIVPTIAGIQNRLKANE